MRELTVNENDAGQRVDKFIKKTLQQLPQNLMYKYIRNKKIKVNKKRCTIEQKLEVGDVLQCYIPEEFFDQPIDYQFLKASRDLNIVYEDAHILIVDKPAGLLVHSDQPDDHDTLIDRVQAYLYDQQIYQPSLENSFAPALANRIDRNTSGLVLAAKDAASLRELNQLIKDRRIDKRYLCIVEGMLSKQQDALCLYHQKQDDNHAKISKLPRDGYKEVRMDYRVLDTSDAYSLVEVLLHTGKSHQIRACFSALHHPLMGDVKYGAKRTAWKYQALCAYSLTFHPDVSLKQLTNLSGKTVCLETNPISAYFNQKVKK